jgi:hypothetical protein
MYTLETFRATLRRTFLSDATPSDAGVYTWSDEQIRDCIWLALDTFANHTAAATATSYTAAGTEYTLPENVYTGNDLEDIANVFVVSSGSKTYLNPIDSQDANDDLPVSYFYTYPNTVLHIVPAPIAGSEITVQYFAFYNHPYADSDTINIPRWAETAVLYLTAAHALTAASVSNANISQWKDRQDSGTPEHNPLRKQQEYLMTLYEKELMRVAPQNRSRRYVT